MMYHTIGSAVDIERQIDSNNEYHKRRHSMEPIIREESKFYAIGYSYEADWTELIRTVDRAAY